jgi:enoyl-CoA hydratase/carnithine racemase
MADNYLIGEKNGTIYTITLNRPGKRNAVTVEMLMGICEMAESQATDPDVRVILLKGEGKLFSAGVDFNSLGAVKKIIQRGVGNDLMTQLDMEANFNSILLRTADFQEGITAMMERRAPAWKRK